MTSWLASKEVERVPEFLFAERIAPVAVRGACQASNWFESLLFEGFKNHDEVVFHVSIL